MRIVYANAYNISEDLHFPQWRIPESMERQRPTSGCHAKCSSSRLWNASRTCAWMCRTSVMSCQMHYGPDLSAAPCHIIAEGFILFADSWPLPRRAAALRSSYLLLSANIRQTRRVLGFFKGPLSFALSFCLAKPRLST